jgi:hypothetical protein
MLATKPSEFRLIPARAGLNAVAVLRRRNLQAGTAILNLQRFDLFDEEKFIRYYILRLLGSRRLREFTEQQFKYVGERAGQSAAGVFHQAGSA